MSAAAEFITPLSAEWVAVRRGHLGASKVHIATHKLKSGKYSAERETLMFDLATERLTGRATEHYVTVQMQRGIDLEPKALAAYEWTTGSEVSVLGWVPHPRIEWTGCTPDGGVGTIGLVEVKCPDTKTHLRTVLSKEIPPEYIDQMTWQMACTGRSFCDFVTFDDRLPLNLQLYILRLERNEERISRLEKEVEIFLGELDAMIQQLEAA